MRGRCGKRTSIGNLLNAMRGDERKCGMVAAGREAKAKVERGTAWKECCPGASVEAVGRPGKQVFVED